MVSNRKSLATFKFSRRTWRQQRFLRRSGPAPSLRHCVGPCVRARRRRGRAEPAALSVTRFKFPPEFTSSPAKFTTTTPAGPSCVWFPPDRITFFSLFVCVFKPISPSCLRRCDVAARLWWVRGLVSPLNWEMGWKTLAFWFKNDRKTPKTNNKTPLVDAR